MAEELLRLQVYLARCGIASRRKCEEYIQNGRIRVNGRLVTVLGSKVAAQDTVEFDGTPVHPETRNVYLVLNKPEGYLCTNHDPFGRPLALDLLTNDFPGTRLFHVGRLDMASSGIIFFTNDGSFAKKVSHPSSEFEKEYVVKLNTDVPKKILDGFKEGVRIEGVTYRIKTYSIHSRKTLRLTLVEGKNREIRRLFENFNYTVVALKRIRIGIVEIGPLESGGFRHLTERERAYFMSG